MTSTFVPPAHVGIFEFSKLSDQNHLCAFPPQPNFTATKPKNNSLCSWLAIVCWRLQLAVLVTITPDSLCYFRNRSGLTNERGRQLNSSHRFIIHPFSQFRIVWEPIVAVVILFSLIVTPLVPILMHPLHDLADVALVLIFVQCTLNALDVVISFLTGVTVRVTREVILNPAYICWHYLLSLYFVGAVVNTVPLQYIAHLVFSRHSNSVAYHILMFFPFLCIFRVILMRRYFLRFCDTLQLQVPLWKVRFYIVLLLILLHWLACVEHYFIITSDTYDVDYKVQNELKFDMLTYVYVDSLLKVTSYFFLIALVDGVSPDLLMKPGNYVDTAFLLCTMILGCVLFTWIFLDTVVTLLALQQPNLKYQEILNQLSNYMSHKQLPENIQQRLYMYYEYKYDGTYYNEAKIMDLLSGPLNKEIAYYTGRSTVDDLQLFKAMPGRMIDEVLAEIKREVFLPNDVIIRAGTAGDSMYFIKRGTVAVVTSNGREVTHLNDGMYFGEVALLMHDNRRAGSVIAIEICDVFRLNRRTFMSTFATQPEVFKMIENTERRRLKKCHLMEELHRKYLIERTLRRSIDNDDFKKFYKGSMADLF